MVSASDNQYVNLLSISGFGRHGWDRLNAARFIARGAFLNELVSDELPKLNHCLAVEAGLVAYLDDFRAAWRRSLTASCRVATSEFWTADKRFNEALCSASDLISNEIARFLDGKGLGSRWLKEWARGFFYVWLLGQIYNQGVTVLGLMPFVSKPRAAMGAPQIGFDFLVLEGETLEEAQNRLRREAKVFDREFSRLAAHDRKGPRNGEAYERYARWYYRAVVKKESINSIALSEFQDPDRRKDIREGIAKVRPLLG